MDKLHVLDYVHSDVRIENIVFPENAEAKLIDFDLAGKVDEKYPLRYNKSVEFWHSEASYDRYSIIL